MEIKNLIIILLVLMLLSIVWFIGFTWGHIQGSMDTMSFCMLQNLTYNK